MSNRSTRGQGVDWPIIALAAALQAGTAAASRTVVTAPVTLTVTTSLVTLPTITLPTVTTTTVLPVLGTTTVRLPLTTTSTRAVGTTTLIVVPPTTAVVPTTIPPPACDLGACDDGFSCTDDVCSAGGCLHVPVDSRCVPPDTCTAATCAPALAGHDAAGCTAGPPRGEGETCAEDGDACTLDVCRGGACIHERVADAQTCAPVADAFRQALALGGLAQGLEADVAGTVAAVTAPLVTRLRRIESDLAGAAHALAGEPVAPRGPAPALAADFAPAVASSVPSQERARIAFTQVLHTPRQVAAFLDVVALARARAALPAAIARNLRHRGRLLLRGTKALKADLDRLRRGGAAPARTSPRGRSLRGSASGRGSGSTSR